MSTVAFDLKRLAGYIVADRRGRVVGRVVGPMYGTRPDEPDALAVRYGLFPHRRKLVPLEIIEEIDGAGGVIGLSVDREDVRSFL